MRIVEALHVAPTSGAPVVSVPAVRAEAGAGLVGDRHHGSRHRHVSLVARDDLDAAADELGRPIAPGATRRNVTVAGGSVPTRPGTRVTIDDVVLEVVRVAAPCRVMDAELGEGGRRALHGRGGAICRVLASGTIRVGAHVEITGPELSSSVP